MLHYEVLSYLLLLLSKFTESKELSQLQNIVYDD